MDSSWKKKNFAKKEKKPNVESQNCENKKMCDD